jgi:hypothetical protein
MERLRPVTDPSYYESVKNLYEKILIELKGEECSIEKVMNLVEQLKAITPPTNDN